jgi:hypothetical protein
VQARERCDEIEERDHQGRRHRDGHVQASVEAHLARLYARREPAR